MIALQEREPIANDRPIATSALSQADPFRHCLLLLSRLRASYTLACCAHTKRRCRLAQIDAFCRQRERDL